MTNTNQFPVPPILPSEDGATPLGEREVDGEVVLDPDVDPDQVDSAEADRVASTGDPETPA